MTEYYATEERAMAPGIAGDWPKVIQKPDNPHGRLVKFDEVDIDELIEASKDVISWMEGDWFGVALLEKCEPLRRLKAVSTLRK